MSNQASTEPLPGARSVRFDRRKEAILNAAGALFNRHGLRDATLSVIAADIGLNLKSLRYYFERREDLVAAAFMRSIAVYQRLVAQALVEDTAEARVRSFVSANFALQASVRRGEQPEFVYFGDLRALSEPHCIAVWDEYNHLFRSIRLLFTQQGQSPRPQHLNAATHMLCSQILWSVVWMQQYLAEDLPRAADRFSDILLRGIAAQPIDISRFAGFVAPARSVEDERLSHDAFLRTATSLINQFGYRGASVERISAELNVTKGAFYHYNDTRDGLVLACFEHSFERLCEAQAAALLDEVDGLSRVGHAAVSLVTRQMRERGTLLRTSALSALGPDRRSEMAAKMSHLTSRFADVINDGIIDGSIIACDVRIAAEMMSTMINSAEELARWVGGATTANAAGLYVQPFLHGLLSNLSP